MKIDDTVRVELDDDDIRKAVEEYVRIKLSTGPDTVSLRTTKLRIYNTSEVRMDGEEPTSLDYGLSASLEFEPVARPTLREVKP